MPGAYRNIYSGLVRLHVLYHASRGPIFGLEMLHELRRHGYQLGPGTLYPLLHSMEGRGLLRAERKDRRRMYRVTAAGKRALNEAKEKVKELFLELNEEDD